MQIVFRSLWCFCCTKYVYWRAPLLYDIKAFLKLSVHFQKYEHRWSMLILKLHTSMLICIADSYNFIDKFTLMHFLIAYQLSWMPNSFCITWFTNKISSLFMRQLLDNTSFSLHWMIGKCLVINVVNVLIKSFQRYDHHTFSFKIIKKYIICSITNVNTFVFQTISYGLFRVSWQLYCQELGPNYYVNE